MCRYHFGINIYDPSNVNNIELLLSLEESHGQIDIHTENDSNFVSAYTFNIQSATFLFKLQETHGMCAPSAVRKSFIEACKYSKIDNIKWIYANCKEHISVDILDDSYERICEDCFKYDDIPRFKALLKWFNELDPIKYTFIFDDKWIRLVELPAKILALISEKRFLEAVQTLGLSHYEHGRDEKNDIIIKYRSSQCSICYDEDIKSYVLTSCHHAYCPDCFLEAFYNKPTVCGVCREPFSFDDCQIYIKQD